MIKVRAYAKVNLALEVMDVVNGYHAVNNIMIPISVFDELSFEKSKKDEVIVFGGYIKDNIIEKALKLFKTKYCIPNCTSINVAKRIPMAAGLAGGSSDAAATLLGLRELFGIAASDEELEELGAQLGSDVPFFIKNRVALCTGRGEKVAPFDFEVPTIDLLIIKTQVGLSTKEVYKHYKYKNESKSTKINNIIDALKAGDVEKLSNNIFNDLEEVSLSLSKELNDLYSLLKKNGYKPFVSGSGPSMYLLNPSSEDIKKIRSLLPENTYVALCHTK